MKDAGVNWVPVAPKSRTLSEPAGENKSFPRNHLNRSRNCELHNSGSFHFYLKLSLFWGRSSYKS